MAGKPQHEAGNGRLNGFSEGHKKRNPHNLSIETWRNQRKIMGAALKKPSGKV
ncbi:hypothetical protein KED40_004838 [Escherichia coli]|nr:hypothetical protein [Escherichia coli]EHO7054636.1 hypothetical protein [Escherichia coli]